MFVNRHINPNHVMIKTLKINSLDENVSYVLRDLRSVSILLYSIFELFPLAKRRSTIYEERRTQKKEVGG